MDLTRKSSQAEWSDEEDQESIIPKSRIKRLAVIDGCNVMHACKGMHYCSKEPKTTPYKDRRADAIGLMLMVKRLLEADYDVRAFIAPSYTSEREVNNYFILEELEKLGILTIVENGQYDDFVILQEAKTRGGFVISQDRFKDFDHIPMLTEAIRRVLRFRFKHFPLGDIGGKKAMQDGRNKFCLGMELDMKLDPEICMADISNCTADIYKNKDDVIDDFLLVHSQRITRSRCKISRALQRIHVIADFLQREFCSIQCVYPPPSLSYFRTDEALPARFSVFLKRWLNATRRQCHIFSI